MVITPDMINGLFELVGGLFYVINIRIILRDKEVKGISLWPVGFFISWGLWNLFYYPYLEQWYSFFGGIFMVGADMIWLGLALYYMYRKKGRRNG